MRLLSPFYSSSFTTFYFNAFGKEVPSASHDDAKTRLGHDKNFLQGLLLAVGAWSQWWGQLASLQGKLQSSQLREIVLLFFVGFTGGLKTTPPSTVWEYTTSCYSLRGALTWVNENGVRSSKNKIKIYMLRPMLILWLTATNKFMCGKHWYRYIDRSLLNSI